jgi:hypothetical protein
MGIGLPAICEPELSWSSDEANALLGVSHARCTIWSNAAAEYTVGTLNCQVNVYLGLPITATDLLVILCKDCMHLPGRMCILRAYDKRSSGKSTRIEPYFRSG